MALAVVNDVVPAHPLSFEEVQNQIRDLIGAEPFDRGGAEACQRNWSRRPRRMGGDLAKAAKSMGLEVKTSARLRPGRQYRGAGHRRAMWSEGFTQARTARSSDRWARRTAAPSWPKWSRTVERRHVETAGAARHDPRRDQEPASARAATRCSEIRRIRTC